VTKPEIAAIMLRELRSMGFRFNRVLADSLYGESSENFIQVLNEYHLNFIVAIRSNHKEWGVTGAQYKYSEWQRFNPRVFSDLSSENRYIREIICGHPEIKY
jgi:SRSO17 transposase